MNRASGSRVLVGLGIGVALCAAAMWAAQAVAADQRDPSQASGMAAIEDGATVRLAYTLTVDGALVDQATEADALAYVQGQGQIIPGLEQALAGLHAGDVKDVTVSPEDGYGPVNPEAFVDVARDRLPKDVEPQVGMMLRGMGGDGQPFSATVSEVKGDTVQLDLNHPLAGKTLDFHVTVVDVTPAS